MRRFLFVCVLSTVTAGGAWALPAADADPPPGVPVHDAAPVVAPAPPELAAGHLAVAAVPDLTAESATAPNHLTAPPPASPAAPAPIVTTTTTTPTPTTTPSTTIPSTTSAPSPPPVETVAFTASQAYGSCSEPIPYDIFSGTAMPGSTIVISSPHGSGTAVADAHGHWERTVEFPSSPRGSAFAVSVSGPGGSTTLSFTATGDSGGHA